MEDRAEVCVGGCEILRRHRGGEAVRWQRKVRRYEPGEGGELESLEFRERTDAVFGRRHPGWARRSDGRVPGVLKWLSAVTGYVHTSIYKFRGGHRRVPGMWWSLIGLLEERQDLRDRLAAEIRAHRELCHSRERVYRPINGERARPLYISRSGDMERIQGEEWRRSGVIR